jgi:hypothetical protein
VLTQTGRNIFEQRYQLSEMDASTQASYLLAGSMILYPIVSLHISFISAFRSKLFELPN